MKKKSSPLGLVGLHFIQRAQPGFHGQIVAEAPGPWVTVEVCAWSTHKPVALRVLNADELRACDLYSTRATWLAAVRAVDAANRNKASA